jgi:hypothetical protein
MFLVNFLTSFIELDKLYDLLIIVNALYSKRKQINSCVFVVYVGHRTCPRPINHKFGKQVNV